MRLFKSYLLFSLLSSEKGSLQVKAGEKKLEDKKFWDKYYS
jgi:hypothetical protein